MTFKDSVCEVCERVVPLAGVCSSVLGALSHAICRECLQEHAEPLWLLHAQIQLCGGPEHIADWVHELKAYKDGKYIGWDEIVACYVPDPSVDEFPPCPHCGKSAHAGPCYSTKEPERSEDA